MSRPNDGRSVRGLVLLLAGFAGLAGACKCQSVPCTTVPCTTVPCTAVPCVGGFDIGGPTPGPTIDIVIGGGGAMTYKENGATMGNPTNDGPTPVLDPTFFAATPVVQLVDSSKGRIWQVKKGKAVVVTFTNKMKLEILRKPAGGLEYTCIDEADKRTTVQSGSDGDLPKCMTYTADSNQFAYTDTATVNGEWFHIETDQ